MMYDKSVKDLRVVRRLGFTVSFRSRTLPLNYSSYILCWTGVVTSMDVLPSAGEYACGLPRVPGSLNGDQPLAVSVIVRGLGFNQSKFSSSNPITPS